MNKLPARQVHLDFHTSGDIPGIAADFDAAAFARTMKQAHVNSATVFARCHHGWMYYDSKLYPSLVHPQLARRDLLVEQVRALHAEGIKAPVYITVQWDYESARRHPEWLIRAPSGAHEGAPFTEPGFYQSLCVNTGYREFLKAHTREVLAHLGDALDGVFFDIVGIRPCHCAACRRLMQGENVDMGDERQVRAFAARTMNTFKFEMSRLVREHKPDATIFYNAGHVGACTKPSADAYSHFELESLPSGGWGYLHFTATGRYARKLGRDCMGMTGKFHKSWGDFHSLKNTAALEFEAFRMLSFGFACSIGDQLEPGGKLNAATYRLIGSVYREIEARERYARGASPLVEAAVITAEDPLYEHEMSENLLGAVQMLEELGVQFDIIDPLMPLDGYRLILIPGDVTLDDAQQARLDDFVARGGAVIACAAGAQNARGAYPACFGARSEGRNEAYPDFIVAHGALAAGLEPENEYAIYRQGLLLTGAGGEEILHANAPYFPRRGDKFCSHSYTPSSKGGAHAAAIQNGRVILFAHPLFAQYRECAPRWVKTLLSNAIDRAMPGRLVRHEGPSTMTVSLLQKEGAVYAHILSYIPVRKSATIDIIEERTMLRDIGMTFDLPDGVQTARVAPGGAELAVTGGRVVVPEIDGYCILELR
ncbi:MAG: alpha-amylase family protein [Christensenellales bacterium]|jgi:hypothetical protein